MNESLDIQSFIIGALIGSALTSASLGLALAMVRVGPKKERVPCSSSKSS